MYKNEKVFKTLNSGEIISIDIKDLSFGSNQMIDVICDKCGVEKKVKYNSYIKCGYKDGGYLCRSCKLKKNNIEKYGVENVFQVKEVKEKIKNNNMEKYGVENVSQVESIREKAESTMLKKFGKRFAIQNSEILDKIKKSNIEKYGVENVSQLDEVKKVKLEKWENLNNEEKKNIIENRKQTNLEKFNVECNLTLDSNKEKSKNTNMNKYGVDNPSKSEFIKNKIRDSNIETLNRKTLIKNKDIVDIDNVLKELSVKCDTCGNISKMDRRLYYKRRENNTLICTICNPIDRNISGKEIINFIKMNYEGEIIENDRKLISPYEIDIYLPEINLAFEFNGVYWHSELYKDRNYHMDKSKRCWDRGIQLIHIWEDDWTYKKDIVKSMILNKIIKTPNKIMARNCVVKEIDNIDIIRDFLNNNHIQGFVGSTIKIGLFHKDELVSLMTFKKSGGDYELNRFCNRLNTTVNGSASKIFKFFIKNNKFKKITSFSNNSYSDGSIYRKLGFDEVYELNPDYSYLVNDVRVHKFNFRKGDNGNIRIYDAGKIKFEFPSEN